MFRSELDGGGIYVIPAIRDVESNALDVFIFQLRTKIEASGARRLIQTVRGFGYTVGKTGDQ